MAFAHFEVFFYFLLLFFFLEGGAAEKVKKKSIDIASRLVKAKQHKHTSSLLTPSSLCWCCGGVRDRRGEGGKGRGGTTDGEQTHICSPGGRGVDCATDRRSDPAALFEQQVKGRAVPQCIVCLVVFGGVLVDADGEGLND